jgi:thiol-disulfide isomerase/thioredoxin
MRKLIFFIIVIYLGACRNQQVPNEIIIEGNVKHIPDGKVYLTEAHRWDIFLDSTTATAGNFIFKILPDSSFYPFLASIKFPDSNSQFKTGGLMFENNHSNGFYLEKGVTIITSDKNKLPWRMPTGGLEIPVIVNAGKQNVVYYENIMNDFGWIGKLDSSKRETRIETFKKQIKTYPYSYFLLESIFNYRTQYSKSELIDLLSIFDKEVRASSLGDKIRRYLVNRPDPGEPLINLSVSDINNKRHNVISKDSKLNMLVFWASWCRPCRAEIPTLKKIHTKFRNKGLQMVSISIDDEKQLWQRALEQENMTWPQYIVEANEIELVQTQYNFLGIPLIVFTDGFGKEITRFNGFSAGTEFLFMKTIDETLANNYHNQTVENQKQQ